MCGCVLRAENSSRMDIAWWRWYPEQAIRSSANPYEDSSVQVLTVPELRYRRWKKVNNIPRQPDLESSARESS